MNTVNNTTSNSIKQQIILRFNKNVKGKKPDTSIANLKHSGKEGHWLELQMGLTLNASNSPDLDGYEMKNNTSSKTTFGDWSADYYIFKDVKYNLTRDNFLILFGKPNVLKQGRYSWSGQPCPRVGTYNLFGQILVVDDQNNIVAYYSYSQDQRKEKDKIIPIAFQQENLVLAQWNASSMKRKLESKFNKKGWFKCLKNSSGVYESIVFGDPINFKNWIESVKIGLVFLDSGMYQGNIRPYSQWRANNQFWDNLIIDRY